MAISERDAREVLREAVEGKIVPRDEAEAFVLADKIDEVLAISEDPAAAIKAITGRPIDVLVYEFTTKDGRRVAGLTSRGIYALAAQRGGFETLDWKFERDGERLWCFVRVRDAHKGNVFIGVASQPLKMRLKSGEEVPDEFAFQKVTTKAERNALRKHLAAVEGIVQDFVLEQKRRGNALVVAAEAEVVEDAVAQAGSRSQEPQPVGAAKAPPEVLNQILEEARQAGLGPRDVAEWLGRKGIRGGISAMPLSLVEPLRQWIREQSQQEEQQPQPSDEEPARADEQDTSAQQQSDGDAGGVAAQPAEGEQRSSGRSRRRRDDVPASGNATRKRQETDQQLL